MATSAGPGSTRDRVLVAAADLFAEQGIRGTSIEQVAEAAGVHRVTVHRVFPGGRDELVAEVLVARARQVVAEELLRVDDAHSAEELMAGAITSFVMLARNDPLLYEGVRSEAAALAMAPERAAQLYDMTLAWAERVAPGNTKDRVVFFDDAARVTDLLARTVLTLVREPGIVRTEDDVRRYVVDFVIPAITRPAPTG